jgi:predicted secreted hydrolase
MAFMAIILVMFACATGSKLLDYAPGDGVEPEQEWGMHKTKVEWWYASGRLTDVDGHDYFFQYTLFQGVLLNFRGYSRHLSITDLDLGKHYFEEKNTIPSGKCKSSHSLIDCRHSSLELLQDSILLDAQGDSLGFDISMKILRDPIWHGSDRVVSMGDPADPKQDSYYYSFPCLEVQGAIEIPDPDHPGKMKSIKVSGDAWIDKQWGRFKPVSWTWFSIRFPDGDRAMLYHFAGKGHMEGPYIPLDKDEYPFTGFEVITNGEKEGNLSWNVEFHNRGLYILLSLI